MTDIAELRRLMEAASETEWSVYDAVGTIQIDMNGKRGERPCIVSWSGFDGNDLPRKTNLANAALICAMKNALPGLLAEVEALKASVARMRKDALIDAERACMKMRDPFDGAPEREHYDACAAAIRGIDAHIGRGRGD